MSKKLGKTWIAMLIIHAVLFCTTCFLTFFDNTFNSKERFVRIYVDTVFKVQELSEKQREITEKNLQDYTKKVFDRMGDKQELASQSFHIILGALLSFLSTSTARIFANNEENQEKEITKNGIKK